MKKSKIGILGSGMVGQVLASGFLKHGYQVMIGARSKEKLNNFIKENNNKIQAGNFNDTAAYGDILVLAVKGSVSKEVLKSIDPEHIANKIIIDATNPIADLPPVNGVISFFTSLDHSLMEELQDIFPYARFVKAFNSIGSSFMVNPEFREGKPTMFICGNDDNSKKQVEEILTEFGWETEDMGKAEAARAIEPLCILWCIPGNLRNDWVHAFKLLRS